jgi:hypothetical protein
MKLNARKIESMIVLALLIPLVTVLIKVLIYALFPVSIWIDYKSITVQDIHAEQSKQEWYIERDVKKVSLQGVYIDEAICDSGTGNFTEVYSFKGDALYQKCTSTKITITVPEELPKGNCYWVSNITVRLPYNITREIPKDIVSNTFKVD